MSARASRFFASRSTVRRSFGIQYCSFERGQTRGAAAGIRVLVPEAALHLYNRPIPSEDDVRATGKRSSVQGVSKTPCVKVFPHKQLRAGIRRPDALHVARPRAGGDPISHRSPSSECIGRAGGTGVPHGCWMRVPTDPRPAVPGTSRPRGDATTGDQRWPPCAAAARSRAKKRTKAGAPEGHGNDRHQAAPARTGRPCTRSGRRPVMGGRLTDCPRSRGQ